ncbi:MAG: hypothetical protein MUO60_20010 [Clostridiaceae bacterium]|nr:hypothetical protein [Clostridiaceae bacterium]
MPIIPKDQLRKLLKEYKVKDAKNILEVLKKLFGDALAEMLEAEFENELGCSKYDYKNKNPQIHIMVIPKRHCAYCKIHLHKLIFLLPKSTS